MTGSAWSARERTSGGGRRYSQHDVDLLREVQRLSQDEGVNLAGIKRIIELTNQVEALQSRMAEMADELDAVAGAAVQVDEHALVVLAARRRAGGDVSRRSDELALTHRDREARRLRLARDAKR